MQNHNEKNPDFFKALEAWKEFAEHLDENLEKIQLDEERKAREKSSSQKKSELEPQENDRAKTSDSAIFDEANDNININVMLANIMEALRVDPNAKPKPREQKKAYQPLERIVKPGNIYDHRPEYSIDSNSQSDQRLLRHDKNVTDFSYDQTKIEKLDSETSARTLNRNASKEMGIMDPFKKITSQENADENTARGIIAIDLENNNKSEAQNQIQVIPSDKVPHNVTQNITGATIKLKSSSENNQESSKSELIIALEQASDPSKGIDLTLRDITKRTKDSTIIGDVQVKQNPLFSGLDDVTSNHGLTDSKVGTQKLDTLESNHPMDIANEIIATLENRENTEGSLEEERNKNRMRKKKTVSEANWIDFEFGLENGSATKGKIRKEHFADTQDKKKQINGGSIETLQSETGKVDTDSGSKAHDVNIMEIKSPTFNVQNQNQTVRSNKTADAESMSQKQTTTPKETSKKNEKKSFLDFFKKKNNKKDLKIDTTVEKNNIDLNESPILKEKEDNHITDYDYEKTVTGKTPRHTAQKNVIESLSNELDRLTREGTPIERQHQNQSGINQTGKINSKILVETNITPRKTAMPTPSQQSVDTKSDAKSGYKFPIFDASARITPEEHLESQSEYEEVIFPEKIEYEDEEQLDITFSFEISRLESEESIHNENDKLVSQESVEEKMILPQEEVDVPVANKLIQFFFWLKRRAQKIKATYQKMRSPDYTLDTFFAQNCVFFEGKVRITKTSFFIFLILIAAMTFFMADTDVKSYFLVLKL